jgi:hypothetical protein
MKEDSEAQWFIHPLGEANQVIAAMMEGREENFGDHHGVKSWRVTYDDLLVLSGMRKKKEIQYKIYLYREEEGMLNVDDNLPHNLPSTELELLSIINDERAVRPELGEIWEKGGISYIIFERPGETPSLWHMPLRLVNTSEYYVAVICTSGSQVHLEAHLCGDINASRPVNPMMIHLQHGWIRSGKTQKKRKRKTKK